MKTSPFNNYRVVCKRGLWQVQSKRKSFFPFLRFWHTVNPNSTHKDSDIIMGEHELLRGGRAPVSIIKKGHNSELEATRIMDELVEKDILFFKTKRRTSY
jgi:hypothetical protein